MSATVPCDASYSLIIEPSSALPIRLEVMKPGERWTCSFSMQWVALWKWDGCWRNQ